MPTLHVVAAVWLIARLLPTSSAFAADWPTARGNPQRTGNVDNQPGPATPHVLWAMKSSDSFLASPVPGQGNVFASGLGAFNESTLRALVSAEAAQQREVWSKEVKMPVVCAPAIAGDLMFIGDGTHQTNGASLYCMQAQTGRPYWTYPLPGKLIHLEGSPTVDKSRVYIGGGNAGVICVDFQHVTLDGKEQDLAGAIAAVEQKWKALQTAYEQQKKKDPDLAIPPDESALPAPKPKLLWQQGVDKWHVDAPVLVQRDRVIVASAFLDDEKIGDRAIIALNSADGSIAWRTPVTFNPWAGATLAGDTLLVGCSNIRFDKKLIGTARGNIVALDFNSGQIKWQKDIPAGVLSSIAVAGDVAVVDATDGKIRAINVADGKDRWEYAAKNPFFGAPAVVDGIVYAADLRGIVHAVHLADGKPLWTFDLAADPAVHTTGDVFGSCVVDGGRVYVATCNIDVEGAEPPQSAVICLADHAGRAVNQFDPVTVDVAKRTITLGVTIAPRKPTGTNEVLPVQMMATLPGGLFAYQSVLTCNCRPSDVQAAAMQLGLKPGKPARQVGAGEGPAVKIDLLVTDAAGRSRATPIERLLVDRRTGLPLPRVQWRFTGSVLRKPDPTRDLVLSGADTSGAVISIFPITDETIFQPDLNFDDASLLKLETNYALLPETSSPAKLVIHLP